MTTRPDTFHQNVLKLYDLYLKVKEAIILAENLDPERKVYIAPLNQLRSSLDHIFKAAKYPEDLDYELKEAKEHINRAGYDAFEVMAGNLGEHIVNLLNEYDTDTLTIVFPEYYQNIKPKLEQIKIDLKEIRTRKNNIEEDKAFDGYFNEVERLLELKDLVYTRINSLQEYKRKKEDEIKKAEEKNKIERRDEEKKRRKEIWSSRRWAFVIGLAVGLIILFLTLALSSSKNDNANPTNNEQPAIEQATPN